jgi:hypothetical protein
MPLTFKLLTDSQKKSFLKILNDINPTHGLISNHVQIMSRKLSFASDWTYYECEDYSSVPNKFQFYLKHKKNLELLKFTDDPVKDNHILSMDLNLNEDTILDYLKFYYKFFTKGAYKLKIIKQSDDIDWQEDLTPMARQSLDKDLLNYPKITSDEKGISVQISCVFQFSIIIISFFITPDGLIEIQDKQSLVDDLPLKTLP